MDPVTLTIAFKGIGMLGIIAGGILIARYGFHLYRDGAGSGRDKTVIEAGPIKVTAHSVGSVVMATAFLWAWAGVAISPSLDKKGDDVRVYSFNTPSGAVESRALAAPASSAASSVQENPQELKALFREAIEKGEQKHTEGLAALAGVPASYDLSSVTTTIGDTGTYMLNARLRAGDKSAIVAFEAKTEGNQVIFVPASVSQAE